MIRVGNIQKQVIEAVDTPSETTPVKSIEQLQEQAQKAPRTKDKVLRDYETVRKQLIDAEADEILASVPSRNLVSETLKNGGMSSSAYETLPKGVTRKAGMSA